MDMSLCLIEIYVDLVKDLRGGTDALVQRFTEFVFLRRKENEVQMISERLQFSRESGSLLPTSPNHLLALDARVVPLSSTSVLRAGQNNSGLPSQTSNG